MTYALDYIDWGIDPTTIEDIEKTMQTTQNDKNSHNIDLWMKDYTTISQNDAPLTWIDIKLALAYLKLLHKYFSEENEDIAKECIKIYTSVLDALTKFNQKEPWLSEISPYYKHSEATCRAGLALSVVR